MAKGMGRPDQNITLTERADSAASAWGDADSAPQGRELNIMATVKASRRPTEGNVEGQQSAQQSQVFWVRGRNPLWATFNPRDWTLTYKGQQWIIVGITQNSGRWYRGRWIGLEARISR